MEVREQKEVEISGNKYIITAFPATYGLGVLKKLTENDMDVSKLDVVFIKSIIITSVTVNNIAFDDKKFDIHFSKKYKEIFDLFQEVVNFNFAVEEEGGESPNE